MLSGDVLRLVERSSKQVQGVMTSLYSILVDELSCETYVKTIYVGFTLDGQMVAAAYPHADAVEVALSLPEDAESPILKDASHLTWPTLPVSIVLRDANFSDEVAALIREAHERVSSGAHDVARPPDFFKARRRPRD